MKKYYKIIIFAVVLIIPVIYSFFYLKSYWDPYGNLKDLKVGIVNLDEGARGKELIKNLKENENTLGFMEVTSDDALEGISNDEFYAVITIPENFTKSIESAGDKEKHKAVITFTPNKRKNYLAYQIINSGLKTAETQLQANVASITVGTMADELRGVPNSLNQIIDGTSQIESGSESLESGLNELSEGTSTLSTKYEEFDSGIKTANDGSKELVNGLENANKGIDTLYNGSKDLDEGVAKINYAIDSIDTSKITDLANGIVALNDGINSERGLSNGINSYINGVHTYQTTIENGADNLKTGLQQYFGGQNKLNSGKNEILQALATYYSQSSDPTLAKLAGNASAILEAENKANLKESQQKLSAGIEKLSNAKESEGAQALLAGENALIEGVTKISTGVAQLNNGTQNIQDLGNGISLLKYSLAKVQDGTSQLKGGVGELQSGTTKIKEGAGALSNGIDKLSTNSSTIKTALEKLSTGTKVASEGSTKLTDGIDELKTSVENGKEVAEEKIKSLEGIEDFVKDPVEFKEEPFGEVESYGIAFTPLFLSIGLWVGALMLYVILYYDQRHRFGILDHEFNNKILQNCIYLGIGAVEGLATGIILKELLGLSVVSMGTFLFECILTGMLFTMIMQFLIRNFGDVGKFLALIILVLQLAASGGTFPVETISKGFQTFTAWLPMTYTVRIFKDCLVKTNASLISGNTIICVCILIALFTLNTIVEFIKNNKMNNQQNNESSTE